MQELCQANGRILLSVVNMIQSASQVMDTVIQDVGLKTLEVLLVLGEGQVTVPHTPGKASGGIRHYGFRAGRAQLADRKVQVMRCGRATRPKAKFHPGLRNAAQEPALSRYMLGALMRTISTRRYHEVLPKPQAVVE